MKKIKSLTWKVKIDDKEYGSKLIVDKTMKTNKEITATIKIVAEQMKFSIQKIITGKADYDIMAEEAIKKYRELGK